MDLKLKFGNHSDKDVASLIESNMNEVLSLENKLSEKEGTYILLADAAECSFEGANKNKEKVVYKLRVVDVTKLPKLAQSDIKRQNDVAHLLLRKAFSDYPKLNLPKGLDVLFSAAGERKKVAMGQGEQSSQQIGVEQSSSNDVFVFEKTEDGLKSRKVQLVKSKADEEVKIGDSSKEQIAVNLSIIAIALSVRKLWPLDGNKFPQKNAFYECFEKVFHFNSAERKERACNYFRKMILNGVGPSKALAEIKTHLPWIKDNNLSEGDLIILNEVLGDDVSDNNIIALLNEAKDEFISYFKDVDKTIAPKFAEFVEKLKFLADISTLSLRERACLFAWHEKKDVLKDYKELVSMKLEMCFDGRCESWFKMEGKQIDEGFVDFIFGDALKFDTEVEYLEYDSNYVEHKKKSFLVQKCCEDAKDIIAKLENDEEKQLIESNINIISTYAFNYPAAHAKFFQSAYCKAKKDGKFMTWYGKDKKSDQKSVNENEKLAQAYIDYLDRQTAEIKEGGKTRTVKRSYAELNVAINDFMKSMTCGLSEFYANPHIDRFGVRQLFDNIDTYIMQFGDIFKGTEETRRRSFLRKMHSDGCLAARLEPLESQLQIITDAEIDPEQLAAEHKGDETLLDAIKAEVDAYILTKGGYQRWRTILKHLAVTMAGNDKAMFKPDNQEPRPGTLHEILTCIYNNPKIAEEWGIVECDTNGVVVRYMDRDFEAEHLEYTKNPGVHYGNVDGSDIDASQRKKLLDAVFTDADQGKSEEVNVDKDEAEEIREISGRENVRIHEYNGLVFRADSRDFETVCSDAKTQGSDNGFTSRNWLQHIPGSRHENETKTEFEAREANAKKAVQKNLVEAKGLGETLGATGQSGVSCSKTVKSCIGYASMTDNQSEFTYLYIIDTNWVKNNGFHAWDMDAIYEANGGTDENKAWKEVNLSGAPKIAVLGYVKIPKSIANMTDYDVSKHKTLEDAKMAALEQYVSANYNALVLL